MSDDPPAEESIWHKIIPDGDQVFAYDTQKLIRVLDRRLGIVYYIVNVAVVVYFCFVLFGKKAYLDNEKSTGVILCTVLHRQKSDLGLDWDIYDRITNPAEMGAVFIPTRILVTRGQTQEDEYCESYIHNCTVPADCDIGNELLQKPECTNGHCMRRQWCPDENPNAATTETHYLEFEQVELWFQAYVHFHKFMLDVSTTDEKDPIEYPQKGANTYPLHDLIRFANLEEEAVMENGAIVSLNAIFRCNLDDQVCVTKVEATNVDTKTGYNHVHNHVYYENGVRKRDSYRFYGIRLITFTTGFGLKTSLPQVVLQLSAGIALSTVATAVADLWMMNVVPERRHYVEQKIIDTEDFHE